MIHPWVQQQLEKFVQQQLPGAITFQFDGQQIRQVEIKTVKKRETQDG